MILPVLISMAVPTLKAIAASIWLAIPNNGHRILTPPLGSITPMYKKYPQHKTTIALDNIMEGNHDVSPNLGCMLLNIS